jgi:hypothetical protein
MVWRVVALAKIATLTEIRDQWTFADLIDAQVALDVGAELMRIDPPKPRR